MILTIVSSFVTIVFCFFVAEIILRVWTPAPLRMIGAKILLPTNTIIRNTYDHKSPKLSNSITITRNSLGFRGEEPPINFAASLSIVAVGGSTTECIMITDGKTWPELVSVNLTADYPAIWVNNAGIDGHSTFGHIELLKQYLSRLKPNMAMFLVGINDMAIDSVNQYDLSPLVQANVRYGRWRELTQNSYVLSLVHLIRAPKGTHNTASITDTIVQYDISGDNSEITPLSETDRTRTTQRLKGYKQRIQKIISLSRSYGILPILITQPAIYGLSIDPTTGINLAEIPVSDFTEPGITRSGIDKWELLEMYNDVTRETGREEGVDVIDLARQMPKNTFFYYDFIHFTEQGAKSVADIVASELHTILINRFPENTGNIQ